MDSVEAFEKVRDIQYRIPLTLRERDDSCSGKSDKLYKLLTKGGHEVRYRVCEFLWEDMLLPQPIDRMPHDNRCTHTYLEVKINGKWIVLDTTWDKGLRNIFHVNYWDGKSDTELAVAPIRIFTPKEGLSLIARYSTKKEVASDLKANGKFYKAFNEWLGKARHSA